MKPKQGFTLIEIIGVLIIIAILATAIVPSLSGEVTRAYADAETQSQESIGNALADYARASHNVLVTIATWSDSLVGILDLPADDIANTKAQGGTRRIVVDPSHGLHLTSGVYNQAAAFQATSSASGSLPIVKPMGARFLIVSGLKGPAPADALTAAEFTAIWNQTAAAPANFVENEFLRIHRLSVSGLFHPVSFTVVASAVVWAPIPHPQIYFAWHRLPMLGVEWKDLENGLIDPFSVDHWNASAAALPWECPSNSGANRTACRNYYGPTGLNVSGGATANCRVNNGLNIHECTCTGAIACWQLVVPASSAAASSAAGSSAAATSSAAMVAGTPAWNLGGLALAAAKNLPVAPTFTVFLLEGTLVNLMHNGAIVGAYVVNGPRSFVYDGSRWMN